MCGGWRRYGETLLNTKSTKDCARRARRDKQGKAKGTKVRRRRAKAVGNEQGVGNMARKHITGAVDGPKQGENVDYEAREAAHTLRRAHEITKNPELHARAKREAASMAEEHQESLKALKGVARRGRAF